jgi:hypothetical protein
MRSGLWHEGDVGSTSALRATTWLATTLGVALALAYSCFAPVFAVSPAWLAAYLGAVLLLCRVNRPRLAPLRPPRQRLVAGVIGASVVAIAASLGSSPGVAALAQAGIIVLAAMAAAWLARWVLWVARSRLGVLSPGCVAAAGIASLAVGLVFAALIARLPVVPTFHHLEVIATGERNAESLGSEVWVRGLPAGGASAADGGWERRADDLASVAAQPAAFRWSGWLARDAELRLVAHPWSGIARVTWDGRTRTVDLFSATGREEVVPLPLPAPPRGLGFLSTTVLLGFLALLAGSRLAAPPPARSHARAASAPLAGFAYGLVVSVFLLTRAPFFVDAPVTGFFRDSTSYTESAARLAEGRLPLFTMRPPGYPVAIALARQLSATSLGLVALQSAASLAAALALVHSFLRIGPAWGCLAAASSAVLLGSGVTLFYETAVLTESLYASALALSAAGLLLGMLTQRWPWFALFSVALGGAILLRPAGLYLIAIAAAVALFLAWRRAPWRCTVAAFAGVGLLVNALSAYNLATAGVYAPITTGAANLVAATSTFWTPTAGVPEALDRHAGRFTARIAPDDAHLLATSWSPRDLFPVYARYYNPAFHDDDVGIRAFLLEASGATDREAFEASYLRHRADIARLAQDSLRARPRDYLKFVWTGLHTALFGEQTIDDPFYETLAHRDLENWSPAPPPFPIGPAVNGFTDRRLEIRRDTPLVAAHERIRGWLAGADLLRYRAAWIAALFLASTWVLVVRRGRHPLAFVAWCLTLYWIGGTVTPAFVQVVIPRYGFPTFFVVYLAPVLLLLLLARPWPPPAPAEMSISPRVVRREGGTTGS